jgi:hypothetical protein
MWRHVAVVRTDVSEECVTSIIKVKRIGVLGTLAVTSNWSTQLVSSNVVLHSLLFSPWWRRRHVPLKHLFSQEPHGVRCIIFFLYLQKCHSKIVVLLCVFILQYSDISLVLSSSVVIYVCMSSNNHISLSSLNPHPQCRREVQWVRFEVFMAVTMKNGVFWDVTPCGSCKNRRFRGT